MSEQMAADLEFERKLVEMLYLPNGEKRSDGETQLLTFVARQAYATTRHCAGCSCELKNINAKIGEFDPEEKGSIDKRLSDLETRDKRHMTISTAAGAGGGVGLSMLFQAIWSLITHKG